MAHLDDQVSDLEEMARSLSFTSRPQLRHRLALVETWAPQPGHHVLEVGCGQGDTTVALAEAVGPNGRVVAIDRGAATDGGSITMGQAHSEIKASPLGARVEFRLSTDLFDSVLDFPSKAFDLVVFPHCSWYMARAEALEESFRRVRPWAVHLGYAEWDLKPKSVDQTAHLLAILLQVHIRTIWADPPKGNIYSLISPDQAREMAESAGWQVVKETRTGTSMPLEDGKKWEIYWANHMAEQLAATNDVTVTEYAKETVLAQARLLAKVSERRRKQSLSTYVLLAR